MKLTRRKFLKVAGSSFAILSGGSLAENVFASMSGDDSAKKWGMVIDLAACAKKEGCRDCVEACHRVHNVPKFDDPKEEIKWIWTAPYEEVFSEQKGQSFKDKRAERPVIVLCNHCENPPCVSVCPTKATFKRPDGIVMMDYHRCIGCRYCMAACPYGARSFNWKDPRPAIAETSQAYPTRTKGVVEKCNFCDERLATGRLPACVEACKEKCLIFGNLSDMDSDVRRALEGRTAIQRKPSLGTKPKVYYLL